MSEYKRDDYTYESPDGDTYEITIVQTADRKYVEIKRDGEGEEEDKVSWDVEMLLDIADAVRTATQKPSAAKAHALKKPQVMDRRSEELKSPSETIQASVDQSLGQMERSDNIDPVQSFSPDHIQEDIASRAAKTAASIPPEKRVKKLQ